MKVCRNCVHWSCHLKGFCKLTQTGVGQLWKCEKWQQHCAVTRESQPSDWKSLPNGLLFANWFCTPGVHRASGRAVFVWAGPLGRPKGDIP